jgi:hypothetical protein
MNDALDPVETFITQWTLTGGSELANTHSFVTGLCGLIGVDSPKGSRTDDALNDYVFERRVFQKEADGTESFGRIDAYKRDCFVLEAKQGSDADRKAAEQGEADLDLFGQTANVRLKRGTAKRGTPAWSKAMVEARGQAERYAKALPVDHSWPPFLLVTDVGHCIDVYADFSGTGKQYTQFPDAARFRIALGDLRDANVRARLATIWTDPLSLDPSKEAARVTREIAAHLAELSKRLEKREQNPTKVADFLMRCLFTMFAEDVRLIPEGSFTNFLSRLQKRPENFAPQLSALWQAMDKGGLAGMLGDAGETVLRFNGYLFKDTTAIALHADEIGLLIEASTHKWNHVEPAIFGTLLERALDGKERAKLGAHYTPRAYVERLVMPTIMEPLRADWAGVQAAAGQLIEAGKASEAHGVIEKFHGQLASTKVLDPACGTGNFLYVALARMKELEGEVLGRLGELGDKQYLAELSGRTITPENFLGIEINPRAAAIAQLVLWIGYLQWHFKVNGEGKVPPEPVLRDVKTIENRDALITWDKKVLERDEHGKPLTRWDGETMKLHPVTGKKVPDEGARVEVERYVKPKQAKWPKADFIVGNPPFIGKRQIKSQLGDDYVDALRQVIPSVPDGADLVMYWWDAAARLTRQGAINAFGLVTTNSLTQSFSRRVIDHHLSTKPQLSIIFAIPDAPWVEDANGAAVRVAMTVVQKGMLTGRLETIDAEINDPNGASASHISYGLIKPDLTIGTSIADAIPMLANKNLCAVGYQLNGTGFVIAPNECQNWAGGPNQVIKIVFPLRNGSDLNRRARNLMVIDLYGYSLTEIRSYFPQAYQWVLNNVKPERDQNREESRRVNWYNYGRSNEGLRAAVRQLDRIIVSSVTSKHRFFSFEPAETHIDSTAFAVALDDAYFLGVLSSRFHVIWVLEAGGTLEDRPRYNKATCFDPFPFPADVPEPLKARIRAEAEALDALRKQVLAAHDDLTLTGLYNVLKALKAGRALTDKERDVHDRGLVTLIRQHHDAIDALVAEAYG